MVRVFSLNSFGQFGSARALTLAGWLLCPWAPVTAQSVTPVGGPSDAPVAFVDVTVIPMDRERALTHQTVVVRGDRIAALGPVGKLVVPPGARRIDGRGKYLMPGLADMHVHFWGHPDTTDLLTYLAHGVTTVRDMHSGRGPDTPTLRTKRAIASGVLLGPRIYVAGDPDVGNADHPTAADVATAAASTVELEQDGYDFLKWYAWSSPSYDSAMAAARRVGLRVVGHVPAISFDSTYNVGLMRVLSDRWASIEHLSGYFHYATHGYPEILPFGSDHPAITTALDTAAWMRPGHQWNPTVLRALAVATRQADVWNCPTLAAMTTVQLTDGAALVAKADKDATNPALQQKLHQRWVWQTQLAAFEYQMTKALQEAGAGLLAGTDQGAGGPDLSDELRVLVEKAGLTPYQALVMSTRNVAVFLGMLDSTGTVAAGKRADLVLLAHDPLRDIGATAAPVGVMVGGRWFTRDELDARLAAATAARTRTKP